MTPAGYRVLPAIYDRWQLTYGKDYSSLIFPRLLQTFRRYAIAASTLVDIACGTGSLALLLRPYGWHVMCVDASAGMVREARKKCTIHRPQITVSHQDMRQLRLRPRYNVATCMFDSVNHLTTLRDLRAAFGGISRALKHGGWFIFDVNNDLCFRTLWKGTQTVEHRAFTLHLESDYNIRERRAHSRVKLSWQGSHRRRVQEEVVTERCFSRAELKRTLDAAGFYVHSAEDFNFADVPGMAGLKTLWVAQKTNGR